jgi:ABC-type branched-subunit amino acid transport system substrate-binding protein
MVRYGTEPGYFAAGAYACTQVILDGIRIARDKGPVTREAVLAAATDPARVVTTIYGATRFTAAGDLTPGSVAIYRRAPATARDPAWWETVDVLRVNP